MKTSITFEVVALDRLTRHPNNVKNHTEQQIEQLRASIRRYGFNDPIGVDANYTIIEGDARFQAAAAEGLTEVPVIRLDHLSAKERDAYAIAHNQTQLLTGMDAQVLQSEMEQLGVLPDEYLSLGFSDADMLFIGLDEVAPTDQSGAADEPSVAESQSWTDLIQPIVKTSIRFTDRSKYMQFAALVDALPSRYPNDARVSDRLLSLSREVVGQMPH